MLSFLSIQYHTILSTTFDACRVTELTHFVNVSICELHYLAAVNLICPLFLLLSQRVSGISNRDHDLFARLVTLTPAILATSDLELSANIWSVLMVPGSLRGESCEASSRRMCPRCTRTSTWGSCNHDNCWSILLLYLTFTFCATWQG
jgi:hypothetical protein